MTAPPALLAVTDLSVALSGKTILRDVSFTLAKGEFAGLIGSNGAGKTTLLRTLLGLIRPSSGTIELSGSRRSSHGIGYVPQRVVVDPDLPLRARDLVGLGYDGHKWGVPLPSKRKQELVGETLDSVGASSYADHRVGTLSGGELQRVLIGHALIGRPDLLLLDEPLANLDVKSEQEIVGLLASIAKNQGIAVLLSAHEMNTILPVMDTVVYIADGKVASGPTGDVIRQDVLSKLYGHHVDVLHLHDRVLVVAGSRVDTEIVHHEDFLEMTDE